MRRIRRLSFYRKLGSPYCRLLKAITSERLLRVESNEVGNNLRRRRSMFLLFFSLKKKKRELLLSFVDWADLVTLSKRFQVGSSLLICYPALIVFVCVKAAFVYLRILICVLKSKRIFFNSL